MGSDASLEETQVWREINGSRANRAREAHALHLPFVVHRAGKISTTNLELKRMNQQ